MAKTRRHPLDQGDAERLRKALESCADTKEFLESCKRCKLDVETNIEVNNEQREVAESVLREFFPASP